MPQAALFNEVVEAADSLSVAGQEALVDILRHRLASVRRNELIGYIQDARKEFQIGRAQVATVNAIMDELTMQD